MEMGVNIKCYKYAFAATFNVRKSFPEYLNYLNCSLISSVFTCCCYDAIVVCVSTDCVGNCEAFFVFQTKSLKFFVFRF